MTLRLTQFPHFTTTREGEREHQSMISALMLSCVVIDQYLRPNESLKGRSWSKGSASAVEDTFIAIFPKIPLGIGGLLLAGTIVSLQGVLRAISDHDRAAGRNAAPASRPRDVCQFLVGGWGFRER